MVILIQGLVDLSCTPEGKQCHDDEWYDFNHGDVRRL